MIRKFLTIITLLTVTASISFAQWEGGNAWPDDSYLGGSHGIVVLSDGTVWQSSYYKTDWVTPDGDTILTAPILVFSEDGSTVDTIHTVTDGTTTDTLGIGGSTSGCRGMTADADGNILWVSGGPSKMVKINSETYERMGSILLTEIGSSPTSPSVDENGTIFVGPVVGGGTTAIAMYDADLVYQGNAVVGPPNISRTMIVAPDGNTIYWTPFTGDPQKTWVYSRADEFSAYELADSMFVGMSIESIAWQPGTGLLWVSNDNRGVDSTKSPSTWYGYDLETSTFVDSFSLPFNDEADEFPRSLAFSPDGKTAYVSFFGNAFNRVYKFTNSTVDVEQVSGALPTNFTLEQNYPNPFNPSTVISFAIPKSGLVTLKVYDMLGQEITTLLNEEISTGAYNVSFDGSNLASGTYMYSLRVGDFQQTKKMILMK